MGGLIRGEVQRFANTCRWSWQGWIAAWKSEKSIRQWTIVNAVSVVFAFSLDLTGGERALVLSLGLLILVAELFNTAIEEILDLTHPEHHPAAGKAKDCGSAAVAVAALAGGAAWLTILMS